jgi:hypothetical protein
MRKRQAKKVWRRVLTGPDVPGLTFDRMIRVFDRHARRLLRRGERLSWMPPRAEAEAAQAAARIWARPSPTPERIYQERGRSVLGEVMQQMRDLDALLDAQFRAHELLLRRSPDEDRVRAERLRARWIELAGEDLAASGPLPQRPRCATCGPGRCVCRLVANLARIKPLPPAPSRT